MLKQKIYKNIGLIKKVFALFVLAGSVLLHVFSFVSPASAAGCTFFIDSMWAQPENVTRTSTIYFQATIRREGDGPTCDQVKDIRARFFVPKRNSSGVSTGGTIGGWLIEQQLSFGSSNTITIDGTKDSKWRYSLNSFTAWNELPNPNELEYAMSVLPQNLGVANVNEVNTVDWRKKLSVSGETSGGSGNVISVQVNFDKGSVIAGTDLTVNINVNANDLSDLPAKVAVLTYVGSPGKQVGNNYGSDGKGINKSLLSNNQTYQTIRVSAANNFKDGDNIVRVDIQDANAPYNLYARGTGTIKASGMSIGQPSLSVEPLKDSYSENDTIIVRGQNLPSGIKGVLLVNNKQIREVTSSNFLVSININSTNGFNLKGGNTIQAVFPNPAGGTGIVAGVSNINVGVTGSGTGGSSGTGSGAGSGSNVDCNNPNLSDEVKSKYCLYNPLPTDELTSMFIWLIRGFFGILAIWATGFIIIGAFRMVAAQGNEEAYAAAKKTITWAVIGLVIGILSFSIIAIVQNLLGTEIIPSVLQLP